MAVVLIQENLFFFGFHCSCQKEKRCFGAAAWLSQEPWIVLVGLPLSSSPLCLCALPEHSVMDVRFFPPFFCFLHSDAVNVRLTQCNCKVIGPSLTFWILRLCFARICDSCRRQLYTVQAQQCLVTCTTVTAPGLVSFWATSPTYASFFPLF